MFRIKIPVSRHPSHFAGSFVEDTTSPLLASRSCRQKKAWVFGAKQMYLDSFRKGRVRLEGDRRVVDQWKYKVIHSPLRVIQTIEKPVWDIGLENIGVRLV